MAADRQNLHNELTVVRCQLGERAALDELVELWHERLWRHARRMVERDDHADEVVQETWVRVLRALPRLRDPARFAPWFYGIARRVMIDRLRVKYTHAMEQVGDDPVDGTDVPAFGAEDTARLREELPRLPVIEREALTLHYLEGLPLSDVAEIVGVPEGTVKSRLHRARLMLKKILEANGAST